MDVVAQRIVIRRCAVGLLISLLLAASLFAQEATPETVDRETAVAESNSGWEKRIDGWFGQLVESVAYLPFYNVAPWLGFDPPARDADGNVVPSRDAEGNEIVGPTGAPVYTSIPFVVLWLIVAAVFFTVRMRFVNVRLFRHALDIVRGRFDDPNDLGEVTHLQALSSALSATVGLGNIAGVAIAVSIGGPGATFWMIIAGFLGMTLKFTECTLGQRYRKIDANGLVSGGPMHYLRDGFAKRGLGAIGTPLSVLFTLFCIGASLAGGNAFQVFQSKGVLQQQVPIFADYGWAYGVVMAFFVGIVIIGGIRRIGQTAEKIVPAMCVVYAFACAVLILANLGAVPGAIGAIFSGAFSTEALYGGVIGALITGFKRAAFSNEAGVGSASIAHSAARTDHPVREGIVALLEPFIDTVVVCTMTALVIVITGVYNHPDYAHHVVSNSGAALTNEAFRSVSFLAGWFPWVLLASVVLFAYSTMISWSYYGERCWANLFGAKSSMIYRVLFLGFVVLGSILSGKNALELGDVMILLMAFPNIIGLYVLGGEVREELQNYESDLREGRFVRYDSQAVPADAASQE
ncbi:MAG: alanine:cation symporter family protein [Planctomycetes bacterium]|nr:alanine:cation symporter family protein [Planctomycetota bacterium]